MAVLMPGDRARIQTGLFVSTPNGALVDLGHDLCLGQSTAYAIRLEVDAHAHDRTRASGGRVIEGVAFRRHEQDEGQSGQLAVNAGLFSASPKCDWLRGWLGRSE